MRVIVQCGIKINDEYWFAAGNTNGLFRKDLLTGKVTFVGRFQQEDELAARLYSSVAYADDKLIFSPCYADSIAIYDLREGAFSYIPIEDGRKNSGNKYLKSVYYRNCIYFIPFCASSFLKYDVEHGKLEKLDAWDEVRNKYAGHETGSLIIEEICIDHDRIYMFADSTNQVIILNMETGRFEVKQLDISAEERVSTVCRWEKSIWIVTNKNRIYRWDYSEDHLELMIDFQCDIRNENHYNHLVCATERYIYIVNVYDKDIRAYDRVNDEFVTIEMSGYVTDKQDDYMSLYYYYDLHVIEHDRICLFSFYDGKYIIIDGAEVAEVSEEITLPVEYWEQDLNDAVISEQKLTYFGTSIVEWFQSVLRENISAKDQECRQENIGTAIYDAVMKGGV